MNSEHFYLSLLSQTSKVTHSIIKSWHDAGHKFEDMVLGKTNPSAVAILKGKQLSNLKELLEKFPFEKISDVCAKENITSVSIFDEDYPNLLKEIYDPPTVLFYKGRLNFPNKKHVAIVGSRRASDYGKTTATNLASSLSKHGAIVVSGLAFGIDSCAHQGAVRVNQPTIAVLGSGVDQTSAYPNYHLSLMNCIIEDGGCVVSEYLPTTTPRKHFFVSRNRIITGLSEATVIVECREKSGALITADFAIEQNRQVFAVPGPISSPLSVGPNHLIQQGASIVLSENDLLTSFGLKDELAKELEVVTETASLTSTERDVLQYLRSQSGQPASVDEIITFTKLPSQQILVTLNSLEMNSLLTRNDSGLFIAT